MNMKKPLALLLAAGMTLGLAACGGGTQGGSDTPAGSSNAPASETSSGGAVELNLWSFNIGGFTDAAAWEYYDRSKDHYILHPRTRAQLETALQLLRDKGEDACFSYVRRELLGKKR